MTDSRKVVIWIGKPAPVSIGSALAARGLLLIDKHKPTQRDLSAARAVIFDLTVIPTSKSWRRLHDLVSNCFIYGPRVIIRARTTIIRDVPARLGPLRNRCYLFDSTRSDDDLAEQTRSEEHKCGNIFNSTLTIPPLITLEEDRTLLARAFADSQNIELSEIVEGKSGATVLRVHARVLRAPGAYSLPFLAKLDDVRWIDQERRNYLNYVADYVPFSQKPTLNPDRCLSGAKRGILVGDFVEDALSLAVVCERPEGRNAIYSLFDDALRSWRRHAYADSDDVQAPITELLGDAIRTEKITDLVIRKARAFGLNYGPTILFDRLTAVSKHHYKRGIVHGDLHPGNVMVRGHEAILIDFSNVKDLMPLVADVACLEVAMCFTTATRHVVKTPTQVNMAEFDTWKNEIDQIFSKNCLRYVPPLQELPSHYGWLWSACRQTRVMAAQVGASGKPYACTLVAYLLRRARLAGRPEENATIGAYALVTAENVLRCIEAGDLV